MGTRIPRTAARIIAIAAVFLVLAPAAQAIETRQARSGGAEVEVADAGTPALFNGEVIDMSKSWEGATTCVVAPDILAYAECFSSDSARDSRLQQLGIAEMFEERPAPEGASFAFASCSSYLKLYNGYNYSGSSLWLSTRGLWLNLSSYGFNQKASSYKVGGCSSIMADYSNGGGAWISTSLTQAWDVDAVISGSWNNDVSSVYIY